MLSIGVERHANRKCTSGVYIPDTVLNDHTRDLERKRECGKSVAKFRVSRLPGAPCRNGSATRWRSGRHGWCGGRPPGRPPPAPPSTPPPRSSHPGGLHDPTIHWDCPVVGVTAFIRTGSSIERHASGGKARRPSPQCVMRSRARRANEPGHNIKLAIRSLADACRMRPTRL